MSYFDQSGEEWITEEVYLAYKTKKKKVERKNTRLPYLCVIKGECTRCFKRKATTRSFRGKKVCQNCNLQIIDNWKK